MRCLACNDLLNAFEATRKSDVTKEYLDLCNKCLSTLDFPEQGTTVSERFDLEGLDERYADESTTDNIEDEG